MQPSCDTACEGTNRVSTFRHDNDREIPRTPDEIYDLNRAVVRRMTEVFTTRGIPVVPSLGTDVFLNFIL